MDYYEEIKTELLNNEVCKKDNFFVMGYCSDERVYRTVYDLM